jgi:hypothetical protein
MDHRNTHKSLSKTKVSHYKTWVLVPFLSKIRATISLIYFSFSIFLHDKKSSSCLHLHHFLKRTKPLQMPPNPKITMYSYTVETATRYYVLPQRFFFIRDIWVNKSWYIFNSYYKSNISIFVDTYVSYTEDGRHK